MICAVRCPTISDLVVLVDDLKLCAFKLGLFAIQAFLGNIKLCFFVFYRQLFLDVFKLDVVVELKRSRRVLIDVPCGCISLNDLVCVSDGHRVELRKTVLLFAVYSCGGSRYGLYSCSCLDCLAAFQCNRIVAVKREFCTVYINFFVSLCIVNDFVLEYTDATSLLVVENGFRDYFIAACRSVIGSVEAPLPFAVFNVVDRRLCFLDIILKADRYLPFGRTVLCCKELNKTFGIRYTVADSCVCVPTSCSVGLRYLLCCVQHKFRTLKGFLCYSVQLGNSCVYLLPSVRYSL